ncbi:MAG: ABC transporter ATP-binding protein [Candidatus Binataceae bacterium]
MSAASETAAISVAPASELAFPEARALRSRDIFHLVGRAWPFMRPYRRHLLFMFLLMLLALPVGLVVLGLIRIFFDVIGNGNPLRPGEARLLRVSLNASRDLVLWRACIVGGVVTMIIVPLNAFILSYAVWILQRMSNLFRVNLYAHMQELSIRFHGEEKIGDAIFRMFQDSAAIPQVIDGLVIQPIRWIPLAIGTSLFLLAFNRDMGLIALAVLPLEFMLAAFYGTALRRAFITERETAAAATTRIEETLASIKAVKAFSREAFETDRYARDNWTAFLAARNARLMLARYRVWTNAVRALAYVGAAYVGARQVLLGGYAGVAMTAASLGLFQASMLVFRWLVGGAHHLADRWGSLQDVSVAISRVLEMISMPSAELVHSGTVLPPREIQSLAFERVSFGYDPRSPVLDAISFEAKAGELTALAGASGSGKSTIVSLILRFFDPGTGRILLNQLPIDKFDLAAWRAMLSVALQENPLFTATIRQNIVYGRPEASDAEVRVAIQRAGLGDFVRSLQAGLDTVLGEKGAKLSAGQAQRIALARALLRDAPILLLDEPTSALDGETEELVMDGIRDWIADAPARRMALVVTHRRTSASKADRMYRIDSGRLADADLASFGPAPETIDG